MLTYLKKLLRISGKAVIYPIPVPPFEFDNFEKLTKKQAQEYFDWYIACIPERVKVLEELFNNKWHCNIQFDYSLESLDPLWAAFEKHIEIEVRTEKQIRAEHNGFPEYVIEEALKDKRKISNKSLIIALDIGTYFGEVITRQIPGIYWGFFTRPKKMMSVNQPVLLGFRYSDYNDYMDPGWMMNVACSKFLDEPNPHYLSELIDIWTKKLPYAELPE